MIDLAISLENDARGTTIVETNHGDQLAAPDWPQDSDFRLVAFNAKGGECEVVPPRELARDIARALRTLKPMFKGASEKPAWHRRLTKYAAGSGNL
jgi:hypothetical protein